MPGGRGAVEDRARAAVKAVQNRGKGGYPGTGAARRRIIRPFLKSPFPMPRSALALLALTLLLPLAACDSGDPNDPDTTIRRVVITEIAIDDAPLTDNGNDWDGTLGGGPDIYVLLVNDDSGSVVESFEDDDFSNVDDQDFPLVYDLSNDPIEFTRFNTNLAFDLYDADEPLTQGDDDYMGSTEAFNLQALVDGNRPNFLRLDSADGQISVSIRLRYER